ncbi:MAG TPA: MBOAT family O-acyltransferase [Geobacteraceae bacterium]
MLFNSFVFMLIFLPVTLVGYFFFNGLRLTMAARVWLLFASLFFYGWWDIRYLPLIMGSILFNYTIGGLLAEAHLPRKKAVSQNAIFITGLAVNILLLVWFKYMDFFVTTVNGVAHTSLPLMRIVLPLGISFFTITQIAFLVDAKEGLVEERDFLNYALFVTFFPHLLAGPILHHKEMMPQFDRLRNKVVGWRNIYLGLILFFIGLFKKVLIADQFATWATPGFDTATSLNFFEAWLASLSYTFQLYFDFSGYSDMAIGIGWMFSIQLPVNFNSPYKACSIIDFWKRWHITLTNFVTTYLYTPILRSFGRITFGVSLSAIFLSMLISGFWHGAGWTFILWGGMHGVALAVNHLWIKRKMKMPRLLAWLITFNFVNLAFVFFRARSLQSAIKVVEGMSGANGIILHKSLRQVNFLKMLGVKFDKAWLDGINGSDRAWVYSLLALIFVVFCKNSIQLIDSVKLDWKHFAFLLILAFCGLININQVSEFLYFQF